MLVPELVEGGDDAGAELGTCVRVNLCERRERRARGPVRPTRGEGVVGVGDEDDAGRERDRFAVEPIRIAVAVDPLVARARALPDERVEVELGGRARTGSSRR